MLKRIFLLFSFSFFFLLVGTARAANFTVNNNADTSDAAAGNGVCADAIGNCTLRAAVEEANALSGDDAINFAASLMNATITLTTGIEITINGAGGTLQITGPGADKLTIDGGAGSNRIFFTTNAATLTITGITMQGGGSIGAGPEGGAINASGGTLVLNAVRVRNNNAGSNNGGGIYFNGGTNHRILNSTISNNSSANGGGFHLAAGTLFMANSTISGNTVTGQGGGILLSGGTATFRNSTITNNTANSIIGGIEVFSSMFNMGNTIIAGNTAPNFPEIGNFNTTTSAGNNFIGDSPGDSFDTINPIAYTPADIRDQNPLLGMLQNNGGPTPTHALQMTSLAVNAGDNGKAVNPFDNSALTADQRGFSPRTVGGTVDIGAFEFNAAPTAANGSVSGQIVDTYGNSIAGVAVRLTGTQNRLAMTDGNGSYHFDNVETNGFYTVVPSRANYSFSPASRSFSALGVHTEASFTASANRDQTNVIDTAEFFVRQQYLDFLGREPDPSGFNGWVNTIRNCAPNEASCDRVHVSEMFYRSQEFQERGYFVYRFYSAALGRKPDFAEFTPDLERVSGFLTNDQLESAKTQFAISFTSRAAFVDRYGTLSNSQYVDALSQTAGVTLSNRQELVDSLNVGTITRAQALRQIAESAAVSAKYYNQAFVVMEYFGYLRRDPDVLYLNWIQVLDAKPADSRHMVEGFVNSVEYRHRFAAP